jgi:hypothetical protein
MPHIRPTRVDSPGSPFPALPIVTPDAPRRGAREKYGALIYLGVLGLVALTALIGWFAHGVWSLRGVWTRIYVLHDPDRPEAERVQAAYALSRDRRVAQRQYWDMCLRKPLPDMARYVLAEALTAEAMSADPRGYALAVARSDGWPGWLRLLLTRPLAYGADRLGALPHQVLEPLRANSDPMIGLWATYALAASAAGDGAAAEALAHAAGRLSPHRELAALLLAALQASGPRRVEFLDRATLWLRANHPESARIWARWAIERDRLVPAPVPQSRSPLKGLRGFPRSEASWLKASRSGGEC